MNGDIRGSKIIRWWVFYLAIQFIFLVGHLYFHVHDHEDCHHHQSLPHKNHSTDCFACRLISMLIHEESPDFKHDQKITPRFIPDYYCFYSFEKPAEAKKSRAPPGFMEVI